MRTNFLILTCSLVALFFLQTSFAPPASSRDLTVEITNIKNTKGVIEIGLYSKAENFPSPSKQYKVKRVKPTGKSVRYTFSDLPSGKYALAIFHDENSDKKCNRNLIGVPTEAYAFSRNFRPGLSAPKFSDCCVTVEKDKTISIKLVY